MLLSVCMAMKEDPDEISFAAGEPIVVLEKDELYNDGWWKVSIFNSFFFFNIIIC
jgi:hypothetical protein